MHCILLGANTKFIFKRSAYTLLLFALQKPCLLLLYQSLHFNLLNFYLSHLKIGEWSHQIIQFLSGLWCVLMCLMLCWRCCKIWWIRILLLHNSLLNGTNCKLNRHLIRQISLRLYMVSLHSTWSIGTREFFGLGLTHSNGYMSARCWRFVCRSKRYIANR